MGNSSWVRPPLSTKLQAQAFIAMNVYEILLGKASLTLNIYLNRSYGTFPPLLMSHLGWSALAGHKYEKSGFVFTQGRSLHREIPLPHPGTGKSLSFATVLH